MRTAKLFTLVAAAALLGGACREPSQESNIRAHEGRTERGGHASITPLARPVNDARAVAPADAGTVNDGGAQANLRTGAGTSGATSVPEVNDGANRHAQPR